MGAGWHGGGGGGQGGQGQAYGGAHARGNGNAGPPPGRGYQVKSKAQVGGAGGCNGVRGSVDGALFCSAESGCRGGGCRVLFCALLWWWVDVVWCGVGSFYRCWVSLAALSARDVLVGVRARKRFVPAQSYQVGRSQPHALFVMVAPALHLAAAAAADGAGVAVVAVVVIRIPLWRHPGVNLLIELSSLLVTAIRLYFLRICCLHSRSSCCCCCRCFSAAAMIPSASPTTRAGQQRCGARARSC